jgi:hypothetical protein
MHFQNEVLRNTLPLSDKKRVNEFVIMVCQLIHGHALKKFDFP